MKSPLKIPHKKVTKKTIENYVSWFEIPAQNFSRAVAFYNTLYNFELNCIDMNGYQMGLFPEVKGVGGAIIAGEGCTPSDRGPILYLNAADGLDEMLHRVEIAGGRVLMAKTPIGDQGGFFGLFMDTEGNTLALHGID
jgi:predicted enzyme related to lactoylglutathione lyase